MNKSFPILWKMCIRDSNTADNKRQLDNNVFQTNSIAQKYNCQLTQLDYQQEEGLSLIHI